MTSGVDPHIHYSMGFAEWEAAHSARLDLWQWENGGYPKWFKVKVIAWHNLHLLIELHKEDALSRELKRQQKRAKG